MATAPGGTNNSLSKIDGGGLSSTSTSAESTTGSWVPGAVAVTLSTRRHTTGEGAAVVLSQREFVGRCTTTGRASQPYVPPTTAAWFVTFELYCKPRDGFERQVVHCDSRMYLTTAATRVSLTQRSSPSICCRCPPTSNSSSARTCASFPRQARQPRHIARAPGPKCRPP